MRKTTETKRALLNFLKLQITAGFCQQNFPHSQQGDAMQYRPCRYYKCFVTLVSGVNVINWEMLQKILLTLPCEIESLWRNQIIKLPTLLLPLQIVHVTGIPCLGITFFYNTRIIKELFIEGEKFSGLLLLLEFEMLFLIEMLLIIIILVISVHRERTQDPGSASSTSTRSLH